MPFPTADPNQLPVNDYRHPGVQSPTPPDAGTQPRFRAPKSPSTYRYDSSLAPELVWDGQNPAREEGEQLIAQLTQKSMEIAELSQHLTAVAAEVLANGGADGAALQTTLTASQTQLEILRADVRDLEDRLRRLSRPFLNWAGKAERLSFDVPTLPLFVHERLSTEAILAGLQSHTLQPRLGADFFGDPQRSIVDQVLKPYTHGPWVNRLILGDSLVVMNSLLRYEALGGQVQMIFIDPPYGVKFGSNFQPFVRRRDVSNSDDDDMTREPEMVQAYRDTWELGLHSYLTYLRDRLLISRELLHKSGSIFVQISDENLHHVSELLDEVFGAANRVSIIAFKKTGFASDEGLSTTHDFLVWYAKSRDDLKLHPAFGQRELTTEELAFYDQIELHDGTRRPLKADEKLRGPGLREIGRPFARNPMVSPGWQDSLGYEFEFEGEVFRPPPNRHWATAKSGLEKLRANKRLAIKGNTLRFVRYFDDFALQPLGTIWNDTGVGGFVGDERLYVVQTDTRVIERCLFMTTEPGDLVIDPTCGSGTTAYVAEQWGRRWIAIDTSRVPLALARQRLLTATFSWYELADDKMGPAGGFVYKRRKNNKGEEVGGIVPHITLKSIANDEPPQEEILVDRPEEIKKTVRVTGPFRVEATIPTPLDWAQVDSGEPVGGDAEPVGAYYDRMIEVLRRSPVLHVGGGKTVTFKNIRPPARSLALAAEGVVQNGAALPVAFVFGPENGAVSERLVFDAAKEANAKSYAHLYVIGFGIQPNARQLIENCAEVTGITATYVQATLDLQMGDLLKNMRSSQLFSVAGLPDITVTTLKDGRHQVRLLGLDVFDPVTMAVDHRRGDDVPAWFLDTNYDGLCFRVHQAFFPRTSAWDNLKRALKASFHAEVWEHLAGAESEPFTPGEFNQIAVKVIDDRGNELLVVQTL